MLTQNIECLFLVNIPHLSLTDENLDLVHKINATNHTINFFQNMFIQNYDYIWYDRLYQGHILLWDNPCFHKTKTNCYICKFLVLKQEKCYKSTQNLIFSIFCVFSSISPLGDWILRKPINHTNLQNKTLNNNANFLSLGKIYVPKGTFGRGEWNSIGNLATQAVIQNIQEISITQTVQRVF